MVKTVEGTYEQGEYGGAETIKVNWDFSVTGAIEVIRAETKNDALIRVPGELVYRFLEAYLHERKIDVLRILPKGIRSE